jgi:hypothetical protein
MCVCVCVLENTKLDNDSLYFELLLLDKEINMSKCVFLFIW